MHEVNNHAMIHLTIDDKPVAVKPGDTLLQAARENGIAIPTLCYHEALLPYGACRLCLVELSNPRGNKIVASCAYPCEEGLVVRTDSQSVLDARRAVVELLMVSGSHLPAVRALANELGVHSPPRVSLDADDCIVCGLCVRACKEIVGVGAISLTHRGMNRSVNTPFEISSADCIECGTCALVCPTGAIHVTDVARPSRTMHQWESTYSHRACRLCEYEPPGSPFPKNYNEFLGIVRL
jgi:bidirectional [NiFe] hydrogenase diaphorase subunit